MNTDCTSAEQHLDRPVHVRVPLLKLLESFALLRFVRYAQDAVQLLDECLALQEKHQTSIQVSGTYRPFVVAIWLWLPYVRPTLDLSCRFRVVLHCVCHRHSRIIRLMRHPYRPIRHRNLSPRKRVSSSFCWAALAARSLSYSVHPAEGSAARKSLRGIGRILSRMYATNF